ncbi:MAG: hypothetical protein KAR06_01205 [Deltaproteobacteria bacterium]|nr:hypothetical protein [Deltaproteobacteria bacterium]
MRRNHLITVMGMVLVILGAGLMFYGGYKHGRESMHDGTIAFLNVTEGKAVAVGDVIFTDNKGKSKIMRVWPKPSNICEACHVGGPPNGQK